MIKLFFKRMRGFFYASIAVVAIAILLGHFQFSASDFHVLTFKQHALFWLLFRFGILLTFFFSWPAVVRAIAKSYDWPADHTARVTQLRVRYVLWLLLIGLVFQFFN